jgi:hypothetical protein
MKSAIDLQPGAGRHPLLSRSRAGRLQLEWLESERWIHSWHQHHCAWREPDREPGIEYVAASGLELGHLDQSFRGSEQCIEHPSA